MKKISILLFVLLISTSAFSQRKYRAFGWTLQKDVPLNEVKINLPVAIFGSYPEISYERILNADISVGAALGVGLQKERYPITFAFNPYFRWFFGGSSKSLEKYGSGFFIEANGGVFTYNNIFKKTSYSYTDAYGNSVVGIESGKENDFGAGLGFAFGWKYLSKSNWVGEVYLGGGRDFVNDGVYPRCGLSIGKRF